MALGKHSQALEDLDAVCRAEPLEHEVSGGACWFAVLEAKSYCTGAVSPFPDFSQLPDSTCSEIHLPDPLSCKSRLQAWRERSRAMPVLAGTQVVRACSRAGA